MKKKYDLYGNKRKASRQELYTKLISVGYFFSGTIFALSFCYGLCTDQRELAGLCLILSCLMYSMIFNMPDQIIKMRGVVAVVAAGIMHAFYIFSVAYVFSFWEIVIGYIIEIIYAVLVIVKYLNRKKE